MKKIALLLILFGMLVSCSTTEFLKGRDVSLSIDLTPYTDKGFFISPYEYSGDFKLIGIINYELMPDARKILIDDTGDGIKTVSWRQESIKTYQILDSVYNVCTRMGADALISFKINSITDRHVIDAQVVQVYGLAVTGFAIKRKSK